MKNCMKIKNKEKVQSFESQQPYPFKKSFMHQGVHLAPDLLVTAADSSAGAWTRPFTSQHQPGDWPQGWKSVLTSGSGRA